METVDRNVYFEDVRLQMEAKLWGEEYNRHRPPKQVREKWGGNDKIRGSQQKEFFWLLFCFFSKYLYTIRISGWEKTQTWKLFKTQNYFLFIILYWPFSCSHFELTFLWLAAPHRRLEQQVGGASEMTILGISALSDIIQSQDQKKLSLTEYLANSGACSFGSQVYICTFTNIFKRSRSYLKLPPVISYHPHAPVSESDDASL